MDIVVGSVVRAKAGRDRNGYFVVVGLDGGFAYIADGRSRKVEKPKKKKSDSFRTYKMHFKCRYCFKP